MDDKQKSQLEISHRVLDGALNELHKAMHICLDAANQVQEARAWDDPQQMDVIEQTNAIIDVMVAQMRQVIFSPIMESALKRHTLLKQERFNIEYREFIQRNNLMHLDPLLKLEEYRQENSAQGGE